MTYIPFFLWSYIAVVPLYNHHRLFSPWIVLLSIGLNVYETSADKRAINWSPPGRSSFIIKHVERANAANSVGNVRRFSRGSLFRSVTDEKVQTNRLQLYVYVTPVSPDYFAKIQRPSKKKPTTLLELIIAYQEINSTIVRRSNQWSRSRFVIKSLW